MIAIRKKDKVLVLAGKNRGKEGEVIQVLREEGRVLVSKINLVKRHTRPNPAKQIKGGVAEKPMPIHVSNVMILTPGGVPTRIGYKTETLGSDVRRVRIARKGGEVLDKK